MAPTPMLNAATTPIDDFLAEFVIDVYGPAPITLTFRRVVHP
jgi:hypothetical protein